MWLYLFMGVEGCLLKFLVSVYRKLVFLYSWTADCDRAGCSAAELAVV